jgi:hypothetical protein
MNDHPTDAASRRPAEQKKAGYAAQPAEQAGPNSGRQIGLKKRLNAGAKSSSADTGSQPDQDHGEPTRTLSDEPPQVR